MQLKAGLLNNLDAEATLMPYETDTSTYTGPFSSRETASGFGDLVSGLKWNLWGNDGGRTAMAVSGMVEFPTGTGILSSHQVEGGPGAEFAAQLPDAFELRIVSSCNFCENAVLKQREVSFGNLISLTHCIVGPLEGYCPFDTHVQTESGSEWAGVVRIGANYRLTKGTEFFIGNDFGVTGTYYSDYHPFIGAAVRF